MLITRDALREILIKWQKGTMKTHEVHAWASQIYVSGKYKIDDWEDDKSITDEVLACLDGLALNIITKDDVPILLELLETPRGSFDEGIFAWENYLLSIDVEKRKEEVEADKSFKRA